MKRNGCLIIVIVLFLCVGAIYAYNVLDKNDVHTPDYYDVTVRELFKKGLWDQGKPILDEGLEYYPDINNLNELNGQYYYYHKKDYDNARYFLVKAVRDNPQNVTAKQLLVRVEEETKNYSSAICYVNELLEINPYWRGLWRKKIGLYRLQGNDVEADRLLKRLHQIYPNDSTVQLEFAGNLEEQYIRMRRAGDRNGAIEKLYELIEIVPRREAYYMDLANLLLQQGNTDEALQVTGRGVSRIPGSTALTIKRAGILAEEGRYQEAMTYIKARQRFNRNPRLQQFYNGLMAEAADAAKMNDPYVLYGKLYESQKSNDALDYMLNTSLTRGYDEDALYYLAEARRRRGDQPELLYKEYLVYKRMGNLNKAYTLLTTLNEMNPGDEDLANELAQTRLAQANNLIADGFYSEALPYVRFAINRSTDPEIAAAAMSKAYVCYYESRRYDEAMAMLDSMRAVYPDETGYFVRKADVLGRKGEVESALAILDSAMQDTAHMELAAAYCAAYEEMAVPYIKGLIEVGATRRAFDASVNLLNVNPSSREGLIYALNTADQLGSYAAYDLYVGKARSIYPSEADFVVKQAVAYNRAGQQQRSVDMLQPWVADYPGNESLVGAYSESSETLAYQLVKAHMADSAVAVLDRALRYDSDNPQLLYAKGLAFEQMRDYDSAYYYQRKYEPSYDEMGEFKRHLAGLENKAMKNVVSLEYLQGRYGEADVITAVATASYTRIEKNNTYAGRLNYAGRDGSAAGNNADDQVPGGVGLQFQGEWEHRFNDKWSGTGVVGLGTKYFPKLMASLKATRSLRNDIDVDAHLGYRMVSNYSKSYRWNVPISGGQSAWVFDHWQENSMSLINAGVGAAKTWDQLYLSGKLDGFWQNGHIYANAAATLRYFPLGDGRTNITVTGSVGTAPEANIIDYAMPGTFDELNTMVGLGGLYMLNKHLSVGLMGTWHTFYNQSNRRDGTYENYTEILETRYRNLYNVHLQLYVHF